MDLRPCLEWKKTSKEIPIKKGTENDYAEDLKKFYARFDTYDFSKDIQTVNEDLSFTVKWQASFSILWVMRT